MNDLRDKQVAEFRKFTKFRNHAWLVEGKEYLSTGRWITGSFEEILVYIQRLDLRLQSGSWHT